MIWLKVIMKNFSQLCLNRETMNNCYILGLTWRSKIGTHENRISDFENSHAKQRDDRQPKENDAHPLEGRKFRGRKYTDGKYCSPA